MGAEVAAQPQRKPRSFIPMGHDAVQVKEQGFSMMQNGNKCIGNRLSSERDGGADAAGRPG
jgi:hypothetical protein